MQFGDWFAETTVGSRNFMMTFKYLFDRAKPGLDK